MTLVESAYGIIGKTRARLGSFRFSDGHAMAPGDPESEARKGQTQNVARLPRSDRARLKKDA